MAEYLDQIQDALKSFKKLKSKSIPSGISKDSILTKAQMNELIKSHRIVDIRDFKMESFVEGLREGTNNILKKEWINLVEKASNLLIDVVDNWIGGIIEKAAQIVQSANTLWDKLPDIPASFEDVAEAFKKVSSGVSWSSISNKSPKSVKLNPSIYDMYMAGPNLYSNMFDINLLYYTKDSEGIATQYDTSNIGNLIPMSLPKIASNPSNNTFTQAEQDFFGFDGMLTLRLASINIPMPSSETAKVSFLNREIEKASNIIAESNKAKLSLDLDFNLYLLELFLSISGLKPIGYENNQLNGYYNYVPNLNTYQGKKIDLVINIHSLSPYGNAFFSRYAQDINNPISFIVFEDVRFMGTASNIQFKRDSSKRQQAEFEFIFKRVKTIYSSDLLGAPQNAAVSPNLKISYIGHDDNRKNEIDKYSAELKEGSNLSVVKSYNFNIDWGVS